MIRPSFSLSIVIGHTIEQPLELVDFLKCQLVSKGRCYVFPDLRCQANIAVGIKRNVAASRKDFLKPFRFVDRA